MVCPDSYSVYYQATSPRTRCPALELLNSSAQNQTVLGTLSGGVEAELGPRWGCEYRGNIVHPHTSTPGCP